MNMNMRTFRTDAERLKQPSEAASLAFDSKIDTIAEELNRIMLSRPDIEKLIGTGNVEMMRNNSRNYLRFMGAVFHTPDAQVLAETALWAFRTYRSHGFQIAYWPANLDTTVQILRQELPEPMFSEIYPFFEWLILHIPALSQLSETDDTTGEPDT